MVGDGIEGNFGIFGVVIYAGFKGDDFGEAVVLVNLPTVLKILIHL